MQPSFRLCALENTPFIHEPSIDPRSAVGQLLMGVVIDLFLHNAVYFAIGNSRNSALENIVKELVELERYFPSA